MGLGRRWTLAVHVPRLLDGQDLGITVNDDLVVVHVQDHRALQFGWAVGDKLLKVNGVRVRTADEYGSELQRALHAYHTNGEALDFSVRRSGGTGDGGGRELPKYTIAERTPGCESSSGCNEGNPLLTHADSKAVDKTQARLKGRLEAYFGNRFDKKTVDARIDEILAETARWIPDCALEHAVFVETKRTSFFSSAVMCLLTCGIYLFLQPYSDVAVLVITEEGRVILVKNVHSRLGGNSGGDTLTKAMRYLGILLVFSLVPPGIVYLWATVRQAAWAKVRQAAPGVGVFAEKPGQHEQTNVVLQIWEHKSWVYYGIIVALWVTFMLWAYLNRQRGYGTRYYREYKAKDVSAVQYTQEEYCRCNCFCLRRRRGSLRLFFGKYPEEAELNTRISPSMPMASAVVPSAKPGNAYDTTTALEDGGGDPEQRASRIFPCLSMLLILTAIIAQVFTLYGYYSEFLVVMEAHAFCRTARLPAMCTQDHCKVYSVTNDQPSYQYCEHVTWMRREHFIDRRDCDSVVDGECCVGCTRGQFLVSIGYGDATAWTQHLDDAANNIALVLALVSGAIAIRALMNNVKETPELDMDFVQDFYQTDSTHYAMTDELMLKFLSNTFETAERAPIKGEHVPHENWVEEEPAGEEDEEMLPLSEFNVTGRLTKQGNWYEFNKQCKIVQYKSRCNLEQANISIPIRCLGFMKSEMVYAAWAEMPHLTNLDAAFVVVATLLSSAAIVYWPVDLGGPLFDTGEEYCKAQEPGSFQAVLCLMIKPLLVAIFTLIIAPLVLYLRFLLTCLLSQCVVIVTAERVFAVYYSWSVLKFFCSSCCEVPMALRVEVFRHDDKIFFGRMNSKRPPWYVRRLSPTHWTTGEVNMQSIFGNLMLERQFGEVEPLYHLVATVLCSDVENINFKDIWSRCESCKEEPKRPLPLTFGVEDLRHKCLLDMDEATEDHVEGACCVSCGACGGAGAARTWNPSRHHITWMATENPEMIKKRICYVNRAEETAVFVWSFKETGDFFSPCNRFNDVIVTTDRIRLISEEEYKTFDCRTCLCWGACWCSCLRRVFCPQRLRKMRSFLNYSHLEAFSTETSVQPNLCLLNCPCYTTCCAALTSCFTCSPSTCPTGPGSCACPSTAKPRIQIWLKWMQRYAKSLNPDLLLSVRPYKLDEFEQTTHDGTDVGTEDEEGRSCCGLRNQRPRGSGKSDQEDVETLRILMEQVLINEERRG